MVTRDIHSRTSHFVLLAPVFTTCRLKWYKGVYRPCNPTLFVRIAIPYPFRIPRDSLVVTWPTGYPGSMVWRSWSDLSLCVSLLVQCTKVQTWNVIMITQAVIMGHSLFMFCHECHCWWKSTGSPPCGHSWPTLEIHDFGMSWSWWPRSDDLDLDDLDLIMSGSWWSGFDPLDLTIPGIDDPCTSGAHWWT